MKRIVCLWIAAFLLAMMLVGCSSKVELDKTELNMTVGDSVELSAGKAVKVNWTSSNDAIVTVNSGTVTAKAAGEADITVSDENGNSDVCHVTVAEKQITSITLSATSARVEIGKTIQLTASFSPADASDTALSWSSSNDAIAAVDEDGYVTGVSEGVVKITCQSSSKIEASCTITVGGAPEPPTSAATAPPATHKPTEAATSAATEKSEDPNDKNASVPDNSPASSGDFIFPDSSTRYLSESEVRTTLSGMSGSPISSSFAQDAVNEIYARHGYVFRTESIRSYYAAQPWYHADPSFGAGDLNPVEQYNISLFSSY